MHEWQLYLQVWNIITVLAVSKAYYCYVMYICYRGVLAFGYIFICIISFLSSVDIPNIIKRRVWLYLNLQDRREKLKYFAPIILKFGAKSMTVVASTDSNSSHRGENKFGSFVVEEFSSCRILKCIKQWRLAWRCHTHNSSQNMSLITLRWAVTMGRVSTELVKQMPLRSIG